jgi:DegV family protein with EDD domain
VLALIIIARLRDNKWYNGMAIVIHALSSYKEADMSSVRIVADSGCDLPPELVARHKITIVACYVQFGQESIPDSDLPVDEFWRRVQERSTALGTAAPPPGRFQHAFQSLVSAGHEVVCLTLPRKHSATYNSAWMAAQEFGQRVRVIDSRSLTLGMGLEVLAAARAALAGLSAEAVQRTVESVRDRTSVIFALDTLEWVRRGGRLDRLMPLIDRVARTFSVKPVVELADGDFHLLGVARSMRAALVRIEEEVRLRLPVQEVAAAYTRGRDAANQLSMHLATMLGTTSSDIIVAEAGPVFATHAGPYALGAALVRAERP